ncbi:MAG: hypothetical protein LBT40_16550 [Deltaproteobacteria bacterium]|jgi:hypothetical protein|nr:hypothetical protein [Deltaproteobacteria bacterium]
MPNLSKTSSDAESTEMASGVSVSGKSPDGSGPSGRMRNIFMAVLAVAVIIVVIFVLVGHFVGTRAWESFSEALDKTSGEGSWTVDSHTFSLMSRTLTVKGISLNYPSSEPPRPGPTAPPSATSTATDGEESPAPEVSDGAADVQDAGSVSGSASESSSEDAGDGAADSGSAASGSAGSLTSGGDSTSIPTVPAASSPTPAPRRPGTFVRIDTFKIQGNPDSDILESLFRDGVLPPVLAEGGAAMFKLASVEGLKGEKTQAGLTTEFEIARFAISDLSFVHTDVPAPVRSPAFLRAMTAGKIELAGYKTGFAAPAESGENFSLSLDSLAAESVSLGPGFSNSDNHYDFLRNLGGGSFSLSSFKTSVSSGGVEAFAAEAASVTLSGLATGGKADSFAGTGLRVTMRDPASPDLKAVLNLDSFECVSPDFTVPLARAGDTADRLATPYYTPSVSRIWQDIPRVSDLVSFPFGIERGSIRGLSASVEPGPSIRINEGVMEGPFTAQTLASGKLELRNIVYTPPEDPSGLSDGLLKTATLLLPKLGQDVLDMTIRLTYASDPSAGLFRATLNEFSAKGAGELSGSVAIEGIRSELMEPLSRVSLSDLRSVSFGPPLENVALQRVQLNYSDRGLLPAYYSLLGEENSMEPTEVRDNITANIQALIRERLGSQMVDPEPLLTEIASFLTAPRTFTGSVAPDPPLSHTVRAALPADDPAAFRNALNITVSANGNEPAPLRFKAPDPDEESAAEDDSGTDSDSEDADESDSDE